MAKVITNGTTLLSGTNNFLTVEAHNPTTSGSVAALTTARRAAFTATSASSNAVGVMLGIQASVTGAGVGAASTYYDVIACLGEQKGACTVDNTTERVTYAAHGLIDGDRVILTAATIPTGWAINTPYYVVNKTANDFQISLTNGGAAVTCSTNGTSVVLHVVRASKQLTGSQMFNSVSNPSASGWLIPFTFTAPYAIDNAANKWGIFVARQGSNTNSPNMLTSDGANIFFAVWSDVTRTFADNDTIYVKGDADELVIDKTATVRGTLGTGATDYAGALIIGRCNTPAVASIKGVRWENPPVSSYTFTIDGTLLTGAHSCFRIGTAASPIPIAQKAILSFPSSTNGTACGITNPLTAFSVGRKSSFFLYGANHSYERTTLNGDVNCGTVTFTLASPTVGTFAGHGWSTGQAVTITTTGALYTGLTAGTIYYVNVQSSSTFWLYDTQANAIAGGATGRVNTSGTQSGTHTISAPIVTTDATGWSVGDKIAVLGATTKSSSDVATARTIATISGNQITLNANLTVKRLSGHHVLNGNQYGIQILGQVTKLPVMRTMCSSNMVFQGCEMIDITGINHGTAGAAGVPAMPWDDAANMSKHYITHCSLFRTSGNGGTLVSGSIEAPPDGFEISYNNCYKLSAIGSGLSACVSFNSLQASGTMVIKNNYVGHSGNSATQLGFASTTMPLFYATITDNVFESVLSTQSAVVLLGANIVFSNNKIFGSTIVTGGLKWLSTLNVSGSGNRFNNNGVAVYYDAYPISGLEFTDNYFGDELANTTDVSFSEGSLVSSLETSPTTLTQVDTTNVPTIAEGSEFKIRSYNDTPGDIRSWTNVGTFVSSGSSIIGKTLTTTRELCNEYNAASGAISGQKCAAIVDATIANAAYYAGTHTLPYLEVFYDSTSVVTSTAANTTLQRLVRSFDPSTDGSNIIIDLCQETDAAYANSGVTWGGLKLRQRKYGFVEATASIETSETNSAIVASLQALSANPFTTEPVQAVANAYTGIAINDGTQTITLTVSHTLKEIYDFIQDYLTLNMGVESFFTTSNGLDYVSSYNITVNGCALTGGGSINMGAKTFSLVSGGTYDGFTWDGSTTSVIGIVGLTANSSVAIFDDSDVQQDFTSTSGITHVFNIPNGSTGTWTYVVAAYGKIAQSGSFSAVGGILGVSVSLETDSDITEPVKATVAAYTTLDTPYQLYDYFSYYKTTSGGIFDVIIGTWSGTELSIDGHNLTVDATAGSVFAHSGGDITIKSNALNTASLLTLGNFTLANGAVTGTTTIQAANGVSGYLTLSGLTNSAVFVKTNSGAEHDYQTGQTGTYASIIPFGSTGTWTWVVKRVGYRHAVGNFTASDGGTFNNTPSTPQKLNPDGSAMYSGTTDAFVSVSFTGTTQANIDIANGSAGLQATFDETEDALITNDGMKWLASGKSDCSQFNSSGGDYLFMSTGWRLRRASAGDVNATLNAFVVGADGTIVDGVNGGVLFLSSDSPTAIAAAVLSAIVDGSVNLQGALRAILATNTGKASGGGSSPIIFRDPSDSTDRVTMDVDTNGNRSSVTLNV